MQRRSITGTTRLRNDPSSSRLGAAEPPPQADGRRCDLTPSVVAGVVAAMILMAAGAAGSSAHPGAAFDAWEDVSMPIARAQPLAYPSFRQAMRPALKAPDAAAAASPPAEGRSG
jgi:hypothetical protein